MIGTRWTKAGLGATLVVGVGALAGCGGGGVVDTAHLTSNQINANKNGDLAETTGDQLAKEVPGGAGKPTVMGDLAADLLIVCAGTNAQPNGGPDPSQAALSMYEQSSAGNATANTASTASLSSSSSSAATTTPVTSDGADTSAVTTTVKNYLSAAASGEGQTACAQLTPGEASALLETVTSNGTNAASCTDALDQTSKTLDASDKQTLISAQVTNVQVTGDTATATVAGASWNVSLQEVDGRWLISGGIT